MKIGELCKSMVVETMAKVVELAWLWNEKEIGYMEVGFGREYEKGWLVWWTLSKLFVDAGKTIVISSQYFNPIVDH